MSLISDLLSRIKQTERPKDIPLGLHVAIESYKKKKTERRRIAAALLILFALMGAGLITIRLRPLLNPGVAKPPNAVPSLAESLERAAAPSIETRGTSPARADATGLVSTTEEKIGEDKSAGSRVMAHENGPARPGKAMLAGVNETMKPAAGSPEAGGKPAGKNAAAMVAGTNEPETTKRKNVRGDALDLYLAIKSEQAGAYQDAIGYYEKVLAGEPDNYKVMNNLALLYLKLNLLKKAEGYLERAVELKHDYLPALINAGIVFAREEKYHEAERAFLKALSLAETDREALLNIAILYEKQGFSDKAGAYYSRLKALGDSEGESGLERINRGARQSDAGARP